MVPARPSRALPPGLPLRRLPSRRAPTTRVHPADLLLGIPADSGSVTAILAEHVMEHLYFDDLPRVLAECRRILRPGAPLRIVSPDALTVVRLLDCSTARLLDCSTARLLDCSAARLLGRGDRSRRRGRHPYAPLGPRRTQLGAQHQSHLTPVGSTSQPPHRGHHDPSGQRCGVQARRTTRH
ncbi:hypothetical protein C8054_06195 [Micromonospora sp. RP3T]|nr:hypothetical protein C8054_06195 [Micromonospora sp. RP3T]